jgi:hypothetical protein
MNFCSWCNEEATHQFKNGKWCCNNNVSKCKKVKEKIGTEALNRPREKYKHKKPDKHKGKTYEEIYGKDLADKMKKHLSNYQKLNSSFLGKKHTTESIEKIRKYALENDNEKHISYMKNFKYQQKDGKIVNLQSTYELAVAEDLDKNNIKWIRPLPLLYFDIRGIKRKYYPDFYLIDFDVYLDPKNDYLIKKDKFKIESVIKNNNIKVFVLNKNDLLWDKIKELISG